MAAYRYKPTTVKRIKLEGDYITKESNGAQIVVSTPPGMRAKRRMWPFNKTIVVRTPSRQQHTTHVRQSVRGVTTGSIVQVAGSMHVRGDNAPRRSAEVTVYLPAGATPEVTSL